MRKVRLAAPLALLFFPLALFAGPGRGGGGSHGGGSGSSGSHGGGSHGDGSHAGSNGGRCGGSHDGSSHRGGRRAEGSHRGGGGGVIYGEPYGGGYVGGDFAPGYGFVDVEAYDWATVDTDVTPGEARVYLEDHYIGAARDFHGDPDYLYLRPGPYKLEFRLDGYEPLSVNLDVIPNATIAIHQELYRVSGATEAKPREALAPKGEVLRYWGKFRGVLEAYDSHGRRPRGEREGDDEQGETREEVRPQPDSREENRHPDASSTARERGRLRLSIDPADAAVYLDGRFLGLAEELAGPDGMPVRAGKHRISIVRPGYETQDLEIEIASGETKRVSVSLER